MGDLDMTGDGAGPAVTERLIRLVQDEGLDDLEAVLATREVEERPLYSRLAQLDFMRAFGFERQNRLMIRTVAHQLTSLTERLSSVRDASSSPFVMMTVLDWWAVDHGAWTQNDGRNALLTPALWVGDVNSDQVTRMRAPSDPIMPGSEFVRRCLSDDSMFIIKEGVEEAPGGPYLERVYVYLSGFTPPWPG